MKWVEDDPIWIADNFPRLLDGISGGAPEVIVFVAESASDQRRTPAPIPAVPWTKDQRTAFGAALWAGLPSLQALCRAGDQLAMWALTCACYSELLEDRELGSFAPPKGNKPGGVDLLAVGEAHEASADVVIKNLIAMAKEGNNPSVKALIDYCIREWRAAEGDLVILEEHVLPDDVSLGDLRGFAERYSLAAETEGLPPLRGDFPYKGVLRAQ